MLELKKPSEIATDLVGWGTALFAESLYHVSARFAYPQGYADIREEGSRFYIFNHAISFSRQSRVVSNASTIHIGVACLGGASFVHGSFQIIRRLGVAAKCCVATFMSCFFNQKSGTNQAQSSRRTQVGGSLPQHPSRHNRSALPLMEILSFLLELCSGETCHLQSLAEFSLNLNCSRPGHLAGREITPHSPCRCSNSHKSFPIPNAGRSPLSWHHGSDQTPF